MSFKDKAEEVAEVNPDALFADGFEGALIGYVQQFSKPPLALYDHKKCIEILVKRDGMDFDEAHEFFSFNVQGSWVGENTPAFAVLFEES